MKAGKTTLFAKTIKAIDIHSHYNHNSVYDLKTDDFHCAEIQELKRKQDIANIEKAFFSTYASVLSEKDVLIENDYNSEICNKYSWAYQWGVIDPRSEESFLQIVQLRKSKKFVGIKIHPLYHKYSFSEYADKILSYANDNHLIVLVHPDEDVFASINRFADIYTDAKIIVAHLGSYEHIDVVKNAKYGNVYTDTSGIASSDNNIIEYAVSRIGSEKILFGTDSYSTAFHRGRIEYADITENDKENILRNNAVRLFGEQILK